MVSQLGYETIDKAKTIWKREFTKHNQTLKSLRELGHVRFKKETYWEFTRGDCSQHLEPDEPNKQKEKEEVKREGRKLLQFLAPVRYSLVPLSDAIQDLCEAIFDLSITPLQARIAPFLKFRETNVTDPKDPLVLDKEKVKEAIMKETLP